MSMEELEEYTDAEILEEMYDRGLVDEVLENCGVADLREELDRRGEGLPSPVDLVKLFEANMNTVSESNFDAYLKSFVQCMDRDLNDSFVNAFTEWSLYK